MATHDPLPLRATDELMQRARRHDARVTCLEQSLDFDQFTVGSYPRFARRAAGAHLWDVDGNEYVDYILGYGTVLLGHADPRVIEAVVRELADGTCLSPLWRPREVELAELLTTVIPNGELCCLVRTGSDATASALRLARIHTSRDRVLQWGYHGWHDWSTPRPAGIPAAVRTNTLTFAYNDLDSVRAAFDRHGSDIACVMMMPFEIEPPAPGFLDGVREMAHAHGALFVLDEMRSGFRLALGGAQEYFGVAADLVTIGKGMSNGHPLSAVVGRADVMRGLGRTHMESTYFGNSAEMAAAIATIGIVRTTDAIASIWRRGTMFLRGLSEIAAEFALPIRPVGLPPCPFLDFDAADPEWRAAARAAFFTETTRRGILFEPDHHWFISAAHSDSDIDRTLEAVRRGFAAAARADPRPRVQSAVARPRAT